MAAAEAQHMARLADQGHQQGMEQGAQGHQQAMEAQAMQPEAGA